MLSDPMINYTPGFLNYQRNEISASEIIINAGVILQLAA